MKMKILSTAIALAFACVGASAIAQDANIKVLYRASIEMTGAKTAAEFLASLPEFQGGVTVSQSVNGGARGEQTAALHAAGDANTLVLINGHRVASFNTGTTVNLSSIPLSSIERVEILSGAAASKYGSDAIAGAVNFVTKKNQTDFVVEFDYSRPQQGASGKNQAFNLSKGWGDYQTDGFNAMASYSHQDQRALNAADRSFSVNGGRTQFNEAGKTNSLDIITSSSQPANARIVGGGSVNSVNPYLISNGHCFGSSIQAGRSCYTNYASSVDLLPSTVQDSIVGSLGFKINDHAKFFTEALLSKNTMTSAYSNPVQSFVFNNKSDVFKNTILPAYLAAGGTQPNKIVQANVLARLVDAGPRTDGFETKFKQWVTGVEGDAFGWDYKAAYTFSENKAIDNALAGYTSLNALNSLIANGTWSPFNAPSAESKAAFAPAVLHQVLSSTSNSIDVINLDASKDVFQLAGGKAKLSLGFQALKQKYSDDPSAISQGNNVQQPTWTDINVGGSYGALPLATSRSDTGTYAQIAMPLTPNWDVSTTTRYDTYSAVKNQKPYDVYGALLPSATAGKKEGAVTFDVSTAFRATENTTLMGSYSTGFKAADMQNMTSPIRAAGMSQARDFVGCNIVGMPLYHLRNACGQNRMYQDTQEFQLFAMGNPDLKGEHSRNINFGIKSHLTNDLSVGFKAWDVKIKDQVSSMSEDMLFADVVKNAKSFIDYVDPQTKMHDVAGILMPINLGTSHYQGIDWDHSYRLNTSLGKVALNWAGTYMLKADSDSGVAGDVTESSVGRFDKNANVTFRVISRLAATWKPSDRYTHTLTMGYRSSYVDQAFSANDGVIRSVNADGTLGDYVDSIRKVHAYTTFDWQSKINYSKNLTVTAGIKNLFNQDPPFSQRNAGGGSALGFDGRYTDPLGRQFYVVGNLKF